MARRVEMALRGRVRRLFGNLGLKVLALALAAAVWFFIASGREAYRELEVPLELRGVAEGFAVNGPVPDTVSIRVAGRGRDLVGLKPSDFKVVVNVADKGAGIHRIDLTPGDVVYAGRRGVTVEGILSEKILMLELERRVTKGVPVKVEFRGAPAGGQYLGLPEVEPALVTLYGSAAILEKVRAVSVMVDAGGRSEPFVAKVPIKAPAGIMLVGADMATVSVPVGDGVRRTFADVPVAARGSGAGRWRVVPAAVKVTLEGEEGRLAALKQLKARVRPSGVGRYRVGVDVPDYVTLVAIAPAEVEVKAGQLGP